MVEVPDVTWADIGGLEDVKRELQEVRLWLSDKGEGMLTAALSGMYISRNCFACERPKR